MTKKLIAVWTFATLACVLVAALLWPTMPVASLVIALLILADAWIAAGEFKWALRAKRWCLQRKLEFLDSQIRESVEALYDMDFRAGEILERWIDDRTADRMLLAQRIDDLTYVINHD